MKHGHLNVYTINVEYNMYLASCGNCASYNVKKTIKVGTTDFQTWNPRRGISFSRIKRTNR